MRDYGLPPRVWGGVVGCEHVWGDHFLGDTREIGAGFDEDRKGIHKQQKPHIKISQGQFCQRCGAWRGCLGLEPTPEMYVEHMVEVFREVWRVCRDDATVWLNLGDSMASGGVGANVNNLLAARIKKGIVLRGGGCALTISSKSNDVLKHDKPSPDHVFTRLLGVERILVKQGDNDFCQILDGLTPITNCWITPSAIASIDQANAEVILNPGDGLRIIISDHNLDANAPLKVSVLAGTAENSQAALSVKKSGKPISKSVGDIQATRDTVSLNTFSEGISKVDLVDHPVALTDTPMSRSERLGDFRVTKASPKHLALTLMNGLIEITFRSVAHLFLSNSYSSLIRYAEVYHQTKQLSNERKAKQELGIPDMVKRALMRDGWICRSTIIWAKTNPMPESVTDRPTKAHEYMFLLTKRARYYYDADAIREVVTSEHSIKRNLSTPRYVGNKRNPQSPTDYINREYTTANGRNRRTVWTLSTKPYGTIRQPDFAGADYVAPDGTPYKASPDCPIHSHLVKSHNQQTVSCDEQLIDLRNCNPDSGDHHDGARPSEQLSSLPHDNQDGHQPKRDCQNQQTSLVHTPESKGGSRKQVQTMSEHVASGDEKIPCRTNHTQDQGVSLGDNLGSQGLDNSQIAIEHNNPSHKTGRALLTNPSCKPFVETPDHTDGIPRSPLLSAQRPGTCENNNDVSPTQDESAQCIQPHKNHKQDSFLDLPSNCTCKPSISQADHFATYPPALVEPCIKAGTSERGVCPECAAPWGRVVEKPKPPIELYTKNRNPDESISRLKRGEDGVKLGHGQKVQDWLNENPSTTTGWRPTCSCGAPPGVRPDDMEHILSPVGERAGNDPSMKTGRAGYNRPRGEDEGRRPMTRYEQRRYAEQLRASPYQAKMANEAGPAFEHYVRKDRSGARPVPFDLLERWIGNGWLERVNVPEWTPPEPVAATVLDPFVGSGTTLMVARQLGRSGIGLDLSFDYLSQQARKRLELDKLAAWGSGGNSKGAAMKGLPLFEALT